jgi:hypothetical protein
MTSAASGVRLQPHDLAINGHSVQYNREASAPSCG